LWRCFVGLGEQLALELTARFLKIVLGELALVPLRLQDGEPVAKQGNAEVGYRAVAGALPAEQGRDEQGQRHRDHE
jgi:hypothetical protein